MKSNAFIREFVCFHSMFRLVNYVLLLFFQFFSFLHLNPFTIGNRSPVAAKKDEIGKKNNKKSLQTPQTTTKKSLTK